MGRNTRKKKYIVLDTNVILHNATAATLCGKNEIIAIPMVVIEELDNFKSSPGELGKNSRQFSRFVNELMQKGNLAKGVKMGNGGMIKIIPREGLVHHPDIDMDKEDNIIIATAYSLLKKGEDVVLVSRDTNVRLKAHTYGIETEDGPDEKVDFDELYSGYRQLYLPSGSGVIKEFQSNNEILKEDVERQLNGTPPLENEFFFLYEKGNDKCQGVGRFNNGIIRKNPGVVHYNSNVRPKNDEQRIAWNLLTDPDIEIVTLIGKAGTGKTLLAITAGLLEVERNNHYNNVSIWRPVIPAGKDLGYMPGAKESKISHWMEPVYDNLSFILNGIEGDTEEMVAERVENKINSGIIELDVMTFSRGRSIPRKYIIIDEVQNFTPDEVKTIGTRVGKGTKLVLIGDPDQIDNPYLDASSNGLVHLIERVKGEPTFGHVTLVKSERSRLASMLAEKL